ncbi:MAG: aldo/keto reductase [Gracilibacteraceae bacterium]|jgi:predicted aldo/keto reductase-like oxidoreductase|nr:aldo/keto reductase [Gracilibacteraceae bacterium]
METRKYAPTGEAISLLGFGCLRLPLLPDGGSGSIDMAATKNMVRIAMSGGVNYYDTSYIYHQGKSENAIGEALREYPRRSFNLATKMPTFIITSREKAEDIFADQLKKCQVDYFDSYLLHSLNEEIFANCERLGLYEMLMQKKAAGKIRRLGFSFHGRPDTLEWILDSHRWDFAQIQLNYVSWYYSTTRTEYELLAQYDVPVVVMQPLRGGHMASLGPKAAKMLQEADPQTSAAYWGFRFAATKPRVLTVLSGMSTPEQVEDNLRIFSSFRPLSAQEEALLQKAAGAQRTNSEVPCTDCRACMPCPQNVNIPHLIDAYNYYKKSGMNFDFEFSCARLPTEELARHCTACGQCVPLCPQGIDIPGKMADCAELEKVIPGRLLIADFQWQEIKVSNPQQRRS